MPTIDINNDKVVAMTNKLEKLNRSALPVAIRQTLNSGAFDVKKKTMPESAEKEFVQRNKTFFKSNSRVEMARGFNVRSMEAKVGFTPNKARGNPSAVKELEQQEEGGTIKSRSYVPLDTARGGSNKKMVRPSVRLSKVKKVVDSKKARGANRQERFVKSAIHAGKGGFVIGNFDPRVLWKITGLRRSKSNTKVSKKAIYTYKEGRTVDVKATHFMEKATKKTTKKLDDFYIKHGKKQIERSLK